MRKADPGLEPLTFTIDKRDERHGGLAKERCKIRQIVKRSFWGCVEDPVAPEGLDSFGFAWMDRGGVHSDCLRERGILPQFRLKFKTCVAGSTGVAAV
jgi:hypothetical protein